MIGGHISLRCSHSVNTTCIAQSATAGVTIWTSQTVGVEQSHARLGDGRCCCMQNSMDFTPQQTADLLHLRRLYITRRGQLANGRKALLAQVPSQHFSDLNIPEPADNVTKLFEMANYLRDNGTEDHRIYHCTQCAAIRGVCNCLL